MIEWVMAIMALIGTYLNTKKKKSSFVLWMITNCYWMCHNIYVKEYAQAFLFFSFLILAIYGFFSWANSEDDNTLPPGCAP